MDLKEQGLLTGTEENHWYFVGKSRALLRAFGERPPERILDVGAGSGVYSKMLLRATSAKEAVCIDPGYAEESESIYVGKPIAFRRRVIAGDADADVILLMDVLEHVDDDVALVRECSRRAPPGARIVVSVPAFSWLWSEHDVFLDHRRRYTLNGVMSVLRGGGLTPLSGFYFFASIFPGVAALRLLARRRRDRVPKSDLREHHPLTNLILTRVCLAESAVARHNRAFGLTVFAVAEKL